VQRIGPRRATRAGRRSRHRGAGQGKDIVVYASGDKAAIARLERRSSAFAQGLRPGAYGNGSKMKFVANHLVAIPAPPPSMVWP
jgi:hypothetical protein